MKKEQIIVSFVTVIVGILMLIGVTVAWYSVGNNQALVSGMQMQITEVGDVTIALETNGQDISVLVADDIEGNEYADTGLEQLTNIEDGKLAPGAFGKVVFYITPNNENVTACSITPNIMLKVGDETWYMGEVAETVSSGDTSVESQLHDIATRHIAFFADEQMLQEIQDDVPYQLVWTDEEAKNGEEKTAVIYWKWHYEYPFSEEEQSLTAAEKEEKIDIYDEEDTLLGNNVEAVRFHFEFITR